MSLNKYSGVINPSLICLDHLGIRDDVAFLKKIGIEKLHIDIMDNNFVPRFGIYPEIVRDINSEFDFEIDLHFMVENVERSLDEWLKYVKPNSVSFHYKYNKDNITLLSRAIKNVGADVRIAYDTSIGDKVFIESLVEHAPKGVMLLGIIPGVLEQQHRPDIVVNKLKALKKSNVSIEDYTIQVDGGVNFETISAFVKEGVNDLVCGSSTLFKDAVLDKSQRYSSIEMNFKRICKLVESAQNV